MGPRMAREVKCELPAAESVVIHPDHPPGDPPRVPPQARHFLAVSDIHRDRTGSQIENLS